MTFLESLLIFTIILFLCIGAGLAAYAMLEVLKALTEKAWHAVHGSMWYRKWEWRRDRRRWRRSWRQL